MNEGERRSGFLVGDASTMRQGKKKSETGWLQRQDLAGMDENLAIRIDDVG